MVPFNIDDMLDGCMTDMTEQQKRDMIYRHPVSGIYNRNAFIEAQSNYVTNVALVDMDSLKFINDNQSHAMGDGCICQVGSALQQIFGRDAVYHLSGDEFAILFDGPRYQFRRMLKAMELITCIGVSAGFGKTLKEADLALNDDKERRLKLGERAGIGETPWWYDKVFG